MTRYERKLFFERLMALRDAYRAQIHESTGMTVEQAIEFAGRTFDTAVPLEDAAPSSSTATGVPTTD